MRRWLVNEGTDALLIGRATFEQMRGYWPPQTEDATGAPTLRLAQARPFRSSIVLLRYCTVGERGEPA